MPRNEGSIRLADEQVCAPQHKKHLNFSELRKAEVRRIPLPRTPVNKPLKGAPVLAYWHHPFF
jgi:hypothetical protein